MPNLNKVFLMGHLGQDPELRYTTNGTAVVNFSMATSERFTDKNGEQKEKTEWHNIVMWNKLAEIAGEYLKKGASVFIEGKLQTRKWEDRDGKTHYTTEVVAERMQMLGGKRNE